MNNQSFAKIWVTIIILIFIIAGGFVYQDWQIRKLQEEIKPLKIFSEQVKNFRKQSKEKISELEKIQVKLNQPIILKPGTVLYWANHKIAFEKVTPDFMTLYFDDGQYGGKFSISHEIIFWNMNASFKVTSYDVDKNQVEIVFHPLKPQYRLYLGKKIQIYGTEGWASDVIKAAKIGNNEFQFILSYSPDPGPHSLKLNGVYYLKRSGMYMQVKKISLSPSLSERNVELAFTPYNPQ